MYIWYCFVDRNWNPTIKPDRKPKHQHLTLSSAIKESKRLAKRTKSKVLVLQLIHEENYIPEN